MRALALTTAQIDLLRTTAAPPHVRCARATSNVSARRCGAGLALHRLAHGVVRELLAEPRRKPLPKPKEEALCGFGIVP